MTGAAHPLWYRKAMVRLGLLMLLLFLSASPVWGETFKFSGAPPEEIAKALCAEMGLQVSLYDGPEEPVDFHFKGSPEEAFEAFLEANNLRSRTEDDGVRVMHFPPLSESLQKAITSGKNFRLYAIVPAGVSVEPDLVKGQIFGYPHLGEVTLNEKEREMSQRSLQAMIAQGFYAMRCFIPRHLLIIDESVTLVICLECHRMRAFDEAGEHGIIIRPDSDVFTLILESHGVPVAPEL